MHVVHEKDIKVSFILLNMARFVISDIIVKYDEIMIIKYLWVTQRTPHDKGAWLHIYRSNAQLCHCKDLSNWHPALI